MVRNVLINTIIILSSMVLSIGMNFFWVSKESNIQKNYGAANFTGWLLTENDQAFFLRSQFTPDRNNLHYVNVPLKIENKINPKGNIFFTIKRTDEKHLVTKINVDNFSQELELEIDTSLTKESKNKTYDLELDIYKDSARTVPIFNRKPFIAAQYTRETEEKRMNFFEYLHNLISNSRVKFVLLLRPIIAVMVVISLIFVFLAKLTTKLQFTVFDFIFVSIGIPLTIVLGTITISFLFFIFCQRIAYYRKSKICSTTTIPIIFFGSAVLFFTFFSQVAGNKLAFLAFLMLAANTLINVFKGRWYAK